MYAHRSLTLLHWLIHPRAFGDNRRSVLLHSPEEGSGGEFVTYLDGAPVVHKLSKGDAVLFHSTKSHNVATVRRGLRHSLVIELWCDGRLQCPRSKPVTDGRVAARVCHVALGSLPYPTISPTRRTLAGRKFFSGFSLYERLGACSRVP